MGNVVEQLYLSGNSTEISEENMQVVNEPMKICSTSLNHQGDTNQNYNEIPPHIHKTATIQQTENKYRGGCGEIEILSVSKNVKIVQLWKTVYQFLKKLNVQLIYDSALSLMEIFNPREMKHVYTKIIENKYLQQYYSQQPKSRSNSNIHQLVNG